jgi:lipopolysaccharide/colanic/teichoic acid biosynthesis glycosyltransferase
VKKWLFDKIAAGLALILFAPVMAGIAILIKLDSKGLFRQRGQGFNNALIEVYKFRSMYVDQATPRRASSSPRTTHASRANGYFARHRVKPGVTGWAQISGWRGETDTQEKIQRRVEHDLYYIENWSVTFDLYICLMTPFALFRGENAC